MPRKVALYAGNRGNPPIVVCRYKNTSYKQEFVPEDCNVLQGSRLFGSAHRVVRRTERAMSICLKRGENAVSSGAMFPIPKDLRRIGADFGYRRSVAPVISGRLGQ